MAHKHKMIKQSRDRCYTGGAENQAAAGGVEWTEWCSCGAQRTVYSNGFVECGEWHLWDDDVDSDRD